MILTVKYPTVSTVAAVSNISRARIVDCFWIAILRQTRRYRDIVAIAASAT